MTNEQIFEIADKYGWVDDFNRWNFPGDVALLEFVDALAEAEKQEPVAWHEPDSYGNVTTYKDWALANGWLPLYKEKNA